MQRRVAADGRSAPSPCPPPVPRVAGSAMSPRTSLGSSDQFSALFCSAAVTQHRRRGLSATHIHVSVVWRLDLRGPGGGDPVSGSASCSQRAAFSPGPQGRAVRGSLGLPG